MSKEPDRNLHGSAKSLQTIADITSTVTVVAEAKECELEGEAVEADGAVGAATSSSAVAVVLTSNPLAQREEKKETDGEQTTLAETTAEENSVFTEEIAVDAVIADDDGVVS